MKVLWVKTLILRRKMKEIRSPGAEIWLFKKKKYGPFHWSCSSTYMFLVQYTSLCIYFYILTGVWYARLMRLMCLDCVSSVWSKLVWTGFDLSDNQTRDQAIIELWRSWPSDVWGPREMRLTEKWNCINNWTTTIWLVPIPAIVPIPDLRRPIQIRLFSTNSSYYPRTYADQQ